MEVPQRTRNNTPRESSWDYIQRNLSQHNIEMPEHPCLFKHYPQ
jgi:hypothetical protein